MTKYRVQFFYVFLLTALVVSFSSCNNDRKRLENYVALLNKQCPYPVDAFGKCVSVKLVDDTIVYTCQTDGLGNKLPLEKLKSQKPLLVKATELGLLLNQSQSSLDKLLNSGVDLKYDVRDTKSKPLFNFTLRNDSLKQLQQRYTNRDEMRLEHLKLQTDISNIMLPIQVDEYSLFIHQEITATDLVYTYTVDEKKMGMPLSMLKKEEANIRNAIAKSWTSTPTLRKEARLLAKLNRGVVYHYEGKPSGGTFEVRFTPKETATMLAGSE